MKYSAVPNPTSYSDMTETPNKYIGTYADYELDDSTDPSKYTWGKFQGDNGEDGADGIPGKNGENGETRYVHFAYATSADGKTGFSTTDTVGKTYMGQYADFEKADSEDPTKYRWSKFQGPQGPQGEQGSQGLQGLQDQLFPYKIFPSRESNLITDVRNTEYLYRNLCGLYRAGFDRSKQIYLVQI